MNLNTVFFGNTIGVYLKAVILSVAIFTLLWSVKRLLFMFLERRKNKKDRNVDIALHEMASYVKVWFYLVVSIYFGSRLLVLSPSISNIVSGVFIVAVIAQLVMLTSVFVGFFLKHQYAKGKSATTQSAVEIITTITTGLLWIVGFLFILSNFGVEVTSLIAGLGIGGLAVALALQGVLGDLFSSLAIYFDKPFEVGDFIEFQGQSGTVTHIGMKTSRIKTLSGEELVVTNKQLSDGQIKNYSQMVERRISMSFGVLYETPSELLRGIPDTVKTIIDSTDNLRFDRCHFSSFGDSALMFETVYHVEDSSYDKYMDAQQKINLAIVRVFEEKGIEMAYPTQTLYLKKDEQ